jgi:hypothetical protein
MINSRLLELLRSLSPTELTAFGKYLRSPFFNHREDIIRLFQHFLKNREGTGKETAFAAVFPGEPFEEKKYGYTVSFLYQAAQQFLVQQELASQGEPAFQLHLAKTLRSHGLERQSLTALQKAETALRTQPERNIQYHQHAQQLHLERFESEARQRRTVAGSFQAMAEEGDIHFAAQKLRQGCTALVYKAVSEADYQLNFLEEALVMVERRQWQSLPAVGMYYFAYRALSEADAQPWFEKLREAMNLHFRHFTKAEMRDIYTLAVNYCIRQINTRQGEQGFYLQQVFGLYQEGLENEVFTENGELSRFTYNNIANAGLGLKAFDWVEDFLKKYKDALVPKHRESAYRFNLAVLRFRRSEYGEVLTLLTQTEFDDVLHQLDARRMILRSYYELGEFDALDSLLDSFQIFLRRRRDVGYLRQNYLNLIRLTRKLLQTTAHDHPARERLRAEIANCNPLAEKEWLTQKTNNPTT